MKKKTIFSLICFLCLIVILAGCGKKDNTPDTNDKNNNTTVEENYSVDNTKYASYTADYSEESRNRDYYWNINTDTFDKTKFDGKISFFGNVIESKITGKTLADNGYNFSEVTYYTCNDIFHINDEIEKNYIQKCGQLSKNSKSYPIDYSSVGVPTLINFDKNDNFMNDNVEIYYEYNKTNDYVDFVTETEESNIIFPYFDGIKYDDLSIDLIIEKMGVPTYVSDRTDAEDYPMTFSYYYVYDDYVFKFDFIHITSTKFTGVTYMGRNIFNHSRIEYYYDDNNDETYRVYNFKDLMDDEYKTYLKAINK